MKEAIGPARVARKGPFVPNGRQDQGANARLIKTS